MTALAVGVVAALASPARGAEDTTFFESKIRPVLVQHCYECHASDANIIRGGLLLDSRDGIRAGGDTGPAVVPGDTDHSLILQALRHESVEMPPDGKLSDAVIADFEHWIQQGAPDPREEGTAAPPRGIDPVAAASHWAFQPIGAPGIPEVQDSDWPQNPIDHFILSRLESAGMRPAPPADKATLLRRATFDLTGLPPTTEELDDFLADDSSAGFARVVDRLLDSPHYGERWGRHWLDLVRYADTNGADENHQMPNAWHYRDWVIDSFNRDRPFDQFMIQQLAGDLLPTPADEVAAGDLLAATGMLVIGPKMLAEQDKDRMIIDIVDEQIDTVTRTMLGLTISCARCHDHKFDPVSIEEYYALAGIFYSTRSMEHRDFVSRWHERPRPSAEIERLRQEYQPTIDEATSALAEARARAAADDAPEDAAAAVTAAEKHLEEVKDGQPKFTMVMAADEAEPTDLPVHIRGNHLTLAETPVPRGLPAILTRTAPAPAMPADQSGRLELAQWIASEDNPLTARVMVNRVWMWHFGQAIVRSPSNFGLSAEAPTHPELLDWLARRWLDEGWSMKQLHRLIMLSATYQMASDPKPAMAVDYAEADPENLLWWRRDRRRLEAEPIRDAVLAVGDALDLSLGGKAPDTDAARRAVYLPVNRANLYEMFSTFDYVETANHIEQRPATVVPHQALFMLNSPLVHEQAGRIATARLNGDTDPELRVADLFRLLYARQPAPEETARALEFVEQAGTTLADVADPDARNAAAWTALVRAMLAANEFIFID